MRIGYISFEYPAETALGGIATYVHQAAKLMKKQGHDVEVFSSSPNSSSSVLQDGLLVHRVQCDERIRFHSEVVEMFSERHTFRNFDLIESPEYFADGLGIKKKFPRLPLVVKLHTPDSFIREMTCTYTTSFAKIRYMAGGILRGRWSDPFWTWRKKEIDIDYSITSIADQIHTPSVSLGDIVSKKWSIPRSKIDDVPYPFIPDLRFLNIPIGKNDQVITYIGRLEVRKGIVSLVKAMPQIFETVLDCRLRLIGRNSASHLKGISMKEYIELKLVKYLDRIEFLQVTPEQIPEVLSETAVCVFPSIWENFPNVCLEAMSAGRAIVGSRNGGMKDMLEQPAAGLLVDPLKPEEIANAIINLLSSSALREKLGSAARNKVLSAYNTTVVGSLMEKKYSGLVKS